MGATFFQYKINFFINKFFIIHKKKKHFQQQLFFLIFIIISNRKIKTVVVMEVYDSLLKSVSLLNSLNKISATLKSCSKFSPHFFHKNDDGELSLYFGFHNMQLIDDNINLLKLHILQDADGVI